MRRSPTDRSPAAASARFAVALACAYLVVAGIGMLRHEMWRDELEVLAKIRGNSLVSALRAPIDTNLYFYALFFWVKLAAGSALAFQAFHLAAATGAVYVFARHGPFSRVQKALFAFGYFSLFEYGIISRDYSFATLLIFLALTVIAAEGKRSWLAVTVLWLLVANHGLFAAFVAAGLATYVAIDLSERAREGALAPPERRRLRLALPLLAAGVLGLVAQYWLLATTRGGQMAPVAQASYGTTLRAVWNAYVPLPDFASPHFWNTNVVPYEPVPTPDQAVALTPAHLFAIGASLGLLTAVGLVLRRRRAALVAWLVQTALVLAFLQYLSVLYMRYAGFLFLALVAGLWLTGAAPARRPRWASPFLTALFALQCAAGLFAWAKDVELPFTASVAAADFIRERGLGGTTVGFVDYVAAPVAIRLDREVYFPETGRFGRYVDWRDAAGRHDDVDFGAVLTQFAETVRREPEPVLFILSFEIKSFDGGPLPALAVEPGVVLTRLAAFEPGIVPDEYYYLYQLHRQ